MKKILIILCLLIFGINNAQAVTPVEFIYINGSNNNNEKMRKWFFKGISKFHPVLKAQLEKDEFTYKHILKDGEYVIETKPSTYFWGYKSSANLAYMKETAQSLQSVSPFIAFIARNVISEIMHDAIWVQKEHNMIPVVQELDDQVKTSVRQGKKVVLLGYSAGTFITLEYILLKAPYINIANWFKDKDLSPKMANMIKNNPRKDTCAAAFVASNLTNSTPLGRVIPNDNEAEFKQAYMNMDNYTDMYCSPQGAVIGVINYASPIPLFYSDLTDPKTDNQQFMRMMYKYLLEQEFFFLTVNYADDPLGFPNGVNYKNKEIAEAYNIDFKQEKGFVYDYSKQMSWRTVLAAHTSYWKTSKRFSKAIVKGYKEGYAFQYGENKEK